jgi:DNA-binding XRE family transcriptional regulator
LGAASVLVGTIADESTGHDGTFQEDLDMRMSPSPAKLLAAAKPVKVDCRPKINSVPKWKCSIRKRRTVLGLHLTEVAKAVGLSDGVVSLLERGRDVRLTTAKRLADFFGCTIEELWSPIA